MKNLLFLAVVTCIGQQAFTTNQSDPYAAIRYNAAFDQESLYQKHANLMKKLGCADNVFPFKNSSDLMDTSHKTKSDKSIDPADMTLSQVAAQEIAAYQKECLLQLRNARYTALAQPGIDAAIEMAFFSSVCLTAVLVLKYLEKSKPTEAGGFAALNAVFTIGFKGKDILKSAYNVKYAPDNFLSILEEHFAKNKCFIPRVLWPQIIKAFISARQSETSQEMHVNFLNFTLGLTLHKPKNILVFSDNKTDLDIKNELNERIDNFFANYDQTENTDSLNHIKINVSKFIDALITPQSPAPRYMYLHGTGGIGKTHFVQALALWISELIPNGINFENLIINSSNELEGNEMRPGLFLKVLRNQSMKNKTGSVIIIDEATWLNDHSMISAAKRTFNGDLSKLSTLYFGSQLDGSTVSLDMPPMLIFVASNEKINDPALESRFDVVQYPLPSKAALTEHAIKIAEQSTILKEAKSIFNLEMISSWLQSLDAKNMNFRYIAGNIEAYLLNKKI